MKCRARHSVSRRFTGNSAKYAAPLWAPVSERAVTAAFDAAMYSRAPKSSSLPSPTTSTRSAATPAEAARAQSIVARELPGISAIDLALILQTFDSIFAKVAFVITFMAGFTVVTGIVVLVGAILTGRFQRIKETVLLRTLGATRRQLTQIQLVE